jgi:hypothetical protein
MKTLSIEKMERIEGGVMEDPWAVGGYCYIFLEIFLTYGDYSAADIFWRNC